MERHKCKLCSRTFVNGRALGGHMKAHLAPLPVPPKTHHHLAAESASTTSSSSFFSREPLEEEEDTRDSNGKAHLVYALRENPKKSSKLPDPEVQDGESETESRNPTRRRSQRKRRLAADPEPLSSVSDTSAEEDATAIAMCLVMLSRDTWPNRAGSKGEEQQKRHRCDVCDKVFRSSQALGGHRVTHRKPARPDKCRKKSTATNGPPANDDNVDGDEKIFECPYCYKVFPSGQALGGHKRSHIMGPANGGIPAPNPKVPISLIDLNLPAPEEEDARSVVSDAEIIDLHGQT